MPMNLSHPHSEFDLSPKVDNETWLKFPAPSRNGLSNVLSIEATPDAQIKAYLEIPGEKDRLKNELQKNEVTVPSHPYLINGLRELINKQLADPSGENTSSLANSLWNRLDKTNNTHLIFKHSAH